MVYSKFNAVKKKHDAHTSKRGSCYRCRSIAISRTSMALSQHPPTRLINVSDPPVCPLPARLGPAKQSACFSVCDSRLEVDSTAALRYFVHPPMNANIRDGLREFMKRPRLDNVFKMCLAAQSSEELLRAEVVTWRGIMTKIILGEKIELNVSYHQGVLYLEEHGDSHRQFDGNSEATYMGHKFESICTASTPSGTAGTSPVDINTLWAAAITRTLGSLNLLLVGEVDCVNASYQESPCPANYIELKTKKLDHGGQKPTIPNRKKWDIQSHLLGASEIFVGFPDAQGVVRQCESMAVRDMEHLQPRIDWSSRVLHKLKEHCADSATEGGAVKVWRVEVRSQHVDIRELGAREVQQLNKHGVARNGIIPVSFIKGLESRRSAA
ncbi:hypothetical protein GGX14DRAFT_692017 [Mycena pura]|uniref:Decapping nuclease n=1 Tax=Mycena pura TaxID=153505 RepID=A0AAD6YUZ0_9AGAR|nr:hypothetical protein GGX14DRAFT_692017 [Mycena pura]